MRVTTDHPASSYGQPVILADDGSVMDYAPGIKAIRAKTGMSTQELAEAVGVSRRTVEGWRWGGCPARSPCAPCLLSSDRTTKKPPAGISPCGRSRWRNYDTNTTVSDFRPVSKPHENSRGGVALSFGFGRSLDKKFRF